ncbi:hypothetical protein [Fluviicola taffensis]|uniref:Uncharacterized protein n=1 Tax=Fluviicola taffensis (strain DSM 16823 / NCIMB 13979 / RW262) TaxID=755732 RepID=F2IGG5_FLUTR|nr:hypothetical protein [Fluviicola taffensis]AEA42571.1 hypothetical protein Fluta_0566 [Fluviicola taffensis DSM 16823]
MKAENCANSNLSVNIKTRRKPRFKAGAELSSAVNLVAIDVNEELIEDTEVFEISIKLDTTRCSREDSCPN